MKTASPRTGTAGDEVAQTNSITPRFLTSYKLAERAQSNREGPRLATADAGREAHRPGCRTVTYPMPEGAERPYVARRNATTAATPPEPGAV